MNLVALVDEYLLDVARLYQPATERKYGQVLEFLVRDLGEKTPIDSIEESDILRCLYRWKDKKPATRALHTSIFRGLFEYAVEKGKLQVNPAGKIKRPRLPKPEDREVVVVSTDQVRRMFFACQNWGDEICLGVLAYTGTRRNAVSMLRWKDLSLTPDPPHGPHGWMRVREKGQKVVDKPIPFFLREIIDRAPEHGPEDYLVPNYRPGAVKRQERKNDIIYRRVKNIAERAGVEAHVHAIRAAFAVFFTEVHRGSLRSLQEWLGHESPETTRAYLRGLDKKVLLAEGVGMNWNGALSEGVNGGSQGREPSDPRLPHEAPSLSALSEGERSNDLPHKEDRTGDMAPGAVMAPVSSPSESVLEVEERVS